ncbi:uncharacterized protein LOC142616545 [Castanea sativa]|uniref:uncharacterized protein LOC142616545 n=1 Tax=Castanea sativa TaxID=21020 RepID=UPI003F64EB36
MVAALPILKNGCCWRVGNGESIKVYLDKWIPKCLANRILHWGQDADREMLVSEFIHTKLNGWRCDTILEKFCEEEATAICKIPLSRRKIVDSVVWMHTKHGKYSVKSGYHLARKVIRNDDEVGSSVGVGGVPESAIHAIWECGVAQDVWAGCAIRLQKCTTNFPNTMALFEYVLDRFSVAEMEEFLVQAWFIWNQRNSIVHGGQMRDLKWLNHRAGEYLDEYRNAQTHITIPHTEPQTRQRWKPPPSQLYKLNFDAAVFDGIQRSGFGAVIKNSAVELMAAMSVKGPSVSCSEETKALACRKALEFAVESGFAELIIEGDNVAIMKAVASTAGDHSLLGHVYEDIRCSIHGLQYADISCIRRGGNQVAHILAKYARNVDNELYWLEDSPPRL